ncbi:unnamed protein product [Cyprideis torosa]|uniref:Uncharacterized protein n=1 Tax=Cyprideis torosa TaxID=163714 RepID=A0A7R8ZL00_9CRUS|nr:unnamed protein product [Cyprideis torosa]CAG0882608.1 unnamed protein product [Cyprideis torosa]
MGLPRRQTNNIHRSPSRIVSATIFLLLFEACKEAVERLEAAAEALSPEGLQGISAEELKQLRTLYDRLLLEYQQQLAVNAELRTSFENAEDLVMVEVTTLKPHQFRIQNDFGMDLTSYFDTGNWESNKLRQYAAALTASYEKGNDKEISFKDEIAEVMNPVRSDVLRVRVDKPFLTDYADKASDAFASAQQTFCETMMSLTRETGNAMTSCSLDKITQGSTVYFASTLTMITSGTTDPLKEVLSSLTTYDGASVLSTEVTLADYLSIQTQAIQDYYGAMSRLVQASNNERVVAAAEEYDFRVPLSTLNLTSPMVDEAKKVYAALQTVYQIVMGRTKFSLLSGCFVTPTEYINELRDNGIGTYYRRLYLEEEVAKLGVNDLSPYVDEPDSQRNLLQRFHKALANSYFLEYHSNSNYSFLPDICAITKPIKFQYLMFKVDKPFDVALKDNTTSVFQDYQNDICGQLISKTMATKKGILLSCGIKHASEGSTVLGVDTTTLVTVPGTDPVESAFSRVGNVMGGKVYGKKITVYNDEVLMSTQEKADIAAREAAEAKAKAGIPQQEEPTSEPTANRFYSVTIPSVIEKLKLGTRVRLKEARKETKHEERIPTSERPPMSPRYSRNSFDQIILLGTRNDCDKRLYHPSDVTGRHCIRVVRQHGMPDVYYHYMERQTCTGSMQHPLTDQGG